MRRALILFGLLANAAAWALPETQVEIVPERTALVVTDPQNDFLAEGGAAWDVVKNSVEENGTIKNLEALFDSAKKAGIRVFISPHYYYPYDQEWKFGGPLEKLMHDIDMFQRQGPL